jgi:hypothetical protein
MIRSYEIESPTNQISKDKIRKKQSIIWKDLKTIRVEKNIN